MSIISTSTRLVTCIAIATLPQTLGAQEAQRVDSAPPFPPASTLQDLERWLRRELPRMSGYSIVTRAPGGTTWSMKYDVANVTLTECTLRFQVVQHMEDAPNRQIQAAIIPLTDVDISKLGSGEMPVTEGYTQNRPYLRVVLVARPGRDSAFRVHLTGYAGGPTTRTVGGISVPVRDEASATRLIAALRRAAVLCGSPNIPAQSIASTRAAVDGQSRPAAQSGAPARMNNNDVLDMVAAGLSDSIIVTSLRQVAVRDFDLSPTGLISLKRANVSDAVIAAMQGTNAPPPAAPPTPAAPRYDPTLTNRPPPPANDPCTGIEDMGLAKRDLISPAMGGVVEWLAQIRNNTAVTKMVVVGWRDMYGQEKQAQVQIRGGEIARVRLDMTQPRVIAPVSNTRVLSCQ